jgi:hypothetical protein
MIANKAFPDHPGDPCHTVAPVSPKMTPVGEYSGKLTAAADLIDVAEQTAQRSS